MAYLARVLLDSLSPDGYRLTTIEATYPRFIHAELMTHRVFSRNAASSRAIPASTLIKRVEQNPFVPTYWGKNQRGMQAREELAEPERTMVRDAWHEARRNALNTAKFMDRMGAHKQLVNRRIEPDSWITTIITATEWSNFFSLRQHPDTQPEFQTIAGLMRQAYEGSAPARLDYGQWHLPLIYQEDLELESHLGRLKLISAGRCARISYLTHDNKRDHGKDVELALGLQADGHMSPFEHLARPFSINEWEARRELIDAALSLGSIELDKRESIAEELEKEGNFRGWHQLRKDIKHEDDYAKLLANVA